MVKLTDGFGGDASSQPFYPLNDMGGYILDANFNRKMMETKYGFRLQELNHNADACSNKDLCEDTATSVSGHSNYKQRIDSMFDDSRSQVSEKSREWADRKTGGLKTLLDEYQDDSDNSVKNNIQEKIEKMFEEISLNGFQTSSTYKKHEEDLSSKKVKNFSHDFNVTYLGCKTLADKSVSLVTLQEPLKDLYLDHKKSNGTAYGNLLTISREGLKIKIDNNVTLNPFPTIAVWASVKFSFRKFKSNTQFAFLPLIKDPDGIDKNVLYRELTKDEEKCINETCEDDRNSPPIFCVVMKNGQLKILECHAFICYSSEEAIVIAANLYQALMKKIKKKDSTTDTDGCITSSESEKERELESSLEKEKKKPAPPVPSRPPRKISKEKAPEKEMVTKLKKSFEEDERSQQRRRGSVPVNAFSSNSIEPAASLRRSVSERRNNGIVESTDGDILTKVAIPRSRSFLNANGPLTRYSRKYKMSAHSDGEVTSPLGFNELFHEFRQNEGLESMDDILNAIIDAEGMSFNDLKPIYKEFLLKLAVTLTKDELFQRSKNIMRKQKKKSRSRSLRKNNFVSATGLRKVFRKTASKLSKPKSSRPTTLEFTSVVFQSGGKNFETSTSSGCSTLARKEKKEVRRRPSSRRRSKKQDRKQTRVSCTSDDSDSFQRRNGNESGGFPNRSSSGYFSCSECSYDSENCTCTSADKCYCTLGTRRDTEKDKMSVASCGCDTESCANSEKCYCTEAHNGDAAKGICQTPHLHQTKQHNINCPNYSKVDKSCKKHRPTIFEQLKEQGFAASDSSLSRAASPSTAWRNNEEKVTNPKECLRASRSLEFLQIRPQRSASRQQIHECPPPPPVVSEPRGSNYVEGTRHFCYHGEENVSTKKRERERQQRVVRQYSSMRARPSHMDVSTLRHRNRVFNSMRAKSVQDDIMNHVLFPERNGSTSSSLRFVRRMDVYNSFSSRRCVERQGSYLDLLNEIQNRFSSQPYPDRAVCPHDQLIYMTNGSDNFRKIDYDLFTAPPARSETSETNSNGSERKVLVVSARDPKGKVLYMGASSRGEHIKHVVKDKNAANASEALSVKKSAEIAALFSDVGTKHKSRPPSVRSSKTHTRTGSYRLNNIENTLGYLP